MTTLVAGKMEGGFSSDTVTAETQGHRHWRAQWGVTHLPFSTSLVFHLTKKCSCGVCGQWGPKVTGPTTYPVGHRFSALSTCGLWSSEKLQIHTSAPDVTQDDIPYEWAQCPSSGLGQGDDWATSWTLRPPHRTVWIQTVSVLASSLVRVHPDSRVNSASPQAQLLWKMLDQAPQAGLLLPALYAVLKSTLFNTASLPCLAPGEAPRDEALNVKERTWFCLLLDKKFVYSESVLCNAVCTGDHSYT